MKAKSKEIIIECITKKDHSKLNSLEKHIYNDNENVLSGIEEGVLSMFSDPINHDNINEFFIFLSKANKPAYFKLYYELLLFNFDLYEMLSHKQNFDSVVAFDHFLLYQATDYKLDDEIKNYALSILAVLKDSFFIKESVKNKLENKNDI